MMPIFILVLILLLAAGSFVIYGLSFRVSPVPRDAYTPMKGSQYAAVRRETVALIDRALARKYEEVYITSHDGLRLFGKLYMTDADAPFQIMMHGYRSIAERDFCGGLNFALDSGQNVLLVDERAHGKSEGRCLTMGVLERQDCRKWAEYLADRFPKCKIILTGISMGAATVLMASELELPENVKGVIADCPYSSPEAIVKKEIKKRKLPVALTYAALRLVGRIYGRFDPEECSAAEALKHTALPVLLIHGEDDRFVPCEMSRECYAACVSDKTLLTVPGAGHGLSYIIDRAAYEKAVEEFIYKTTGFGQKTELC